MMSQRVPGVSLEKDYRPRPPELVTGVPVFLGFAPKDNDSEIQVVSPKWINNSQPEETDNGQTNSVDPVLFTHWSEFESTFRSLDSALAFAVRGFFENGGSQCYVQLMSSTEDNRKAALVAALKTLTEPDVFDLICAPDIFSPNDLQPLQGNIGKPEERWLKVSTSLDDVVELQAKILGHCADIGCFAILDAHPTTEPHDHRQAVASAVAASTCTDVPRTRTDIQSDPLGAGALYYPWIQLPASDQDSEPGFKFVPPCGHIAGIYSRSDRQHGVHKAPANEPLMGVYDLSSDIPDAQLASLYVEGVNCLRVFPHRGIRVWGARTLSGEYINVKRLFLTVARWIEHNLAGVVFEPNTPQLWARVERELTAYLNGLFQQGALQGRAAQDAFYVRCNAETNPRELHDLGQVVTKIGLAPATPNEFIEVRIVQTPSGVTMNGLNRPE
ncbi:MAG: phage tail sheath subtilisin-like domain-containing protein [Anaerolineae bacterium]|nr:phage tail sheath subtilisin-like domain-containing protein [Anaerolineae bacterium]